MAQAVGISHKNIYYQGVRDQQDLLLKHQIEEVHKIHPAYGHRRVALELKVTQKRALRVMNKYGLHPPRRKIRKSTTTVSTSKHHYTNLIKELEISKPNHVWCSDLTYIKFRGKFVYLSTIKDIYTRRIMAARVGVRHDAELVLTTIQAAVNETNALPEIFHSDQGNEYMAANCTGYLEGLKIAVSVSDKASPWQNPYQESFFGRFKEENGDLDRFESLGELIEELYSYVYYYNYHRIHTALKMPPVIFSENVLEKLGT